MNKKPVRVSLIMVLVVTVFVGFLSGVVGELWINNFLAPEIKFKSYQDFTKSLDELLVEKNREIKDILTEHDNSFVDAIESVSGVTVKIYKYKNPSNQLVSSYLDEEVLGSGSVLTNDGWILTSKQVITDPRASYNIEFDNKTYVSQEIIPDVMTDIVLVKIEADNLPVVDLGTKGSLYLGQSLFVYTLNEGVSKASVISLNDYQLTKFNDLLQSSENYYRFIKLQGDFSEMTVGAPAVNLNGKVVGVLLDTEGTLLPIDYIINVMKNVVQRGVAERNYFGVHFVDLSMTANFDSEMKVGALLYTSDSRIAVLPGSPAAEAGLKVGDIIVKVEQEEINELHSLTSLIQDYPIGSKLKLKILRDGEEQEVEVTLQKI